MGWKQIKRKWTATIEELDAARVADRFVGLDVIAIDSMVPRHPARIAGELKRMRMVPRAGSPTLELTVTDGTADAVAVFTGRPSIAGVEVGRAILLEGVPHQERGRQVMLNPTYTLLPR